MAAFQGRQLHQHVTEGESQVRTVAVFHHYNGLLPVVVDEVHSRNCLSRRLSLTLLYQAHQCICPPREWYPMSLSFLYRGSPTGHSDHSCADYGGTATAIHQISIGSYLCIILDIVTSYLLAVDIYCCLLCDGLSIIPLENSYILVVPWFTWQLLVYHLQQIYC